MLQLTFFFVMKQFVVVNDDVVAAAFASKHLLSSAATMRDGQKTVTHFFCFFDRPTDELRFFTLIERRSTTETVGLCAGAAMLLLSQASARGSRTAVDVLESMYLHLNLDLSLQPKAKSNVSLRSCIAL